MDNASYHKAWYADSAKPTWTKKKEVLGVLDAQKIEHEPILRKIEYKKILKERIIRYVLLELETLLHDASYTVVYTTLIHINFQPIEFELALINRNIGLLQNASTKMEDVEEISVAEFDTLNTEEGHWQIERILKSIVAMVREWQAEIQYGGYETEKESEEHCYRSDEGEALTLLFLKQNEETVCRNSEPNDMQICAVSWLRATRPRIGTDRYSSASTVATICGNL